MTKITNRTAPNFKIPSTNSPKFQLNKVKSKYKVLYFSPEDTKVLLGNQSHWRKIDQTLCTFLTSNRMVNKYFDKLLSMCKKEHSPFEKPLHDIFKSEVCLSPIPSLAIHATNVNSIYGVSPLVNIKNLWEENKYE